MKRVTVLEERFETGRKHEEIRSDEKSESKEAEFTEITLWIDKKEAYRIYDRFEEEEISVLSDGNYQVRFRAF